MKNTINRPFTVARWAVLALSLLLAGVQAARAQTSKLSFTKIDVLNAAFTLGQGVASDGTVAGTYYDQSFVPHGFLRSPTGVFTNPVDVPKSTATAILGIDPPGQFVVGAYLDSAGNQHGFVMRLSDKGFATIDFPGAFLTVPFDMNSGGQIVGAHLDSDGITHHGFSVPVVEASLSIGTFQSIDLPSAAWTAAFGVNDYGDIVGFYVPANSPPQCHSYRLSGGNVTTLRVSSGGGDLANGINDAGNVVGSIGSACPFLLANPAASGGLFFRSPSIVLGLVSVHGYLLARDGTVTAVNLPGVQSTQPNRINSSGMIVGFYNTAPGPGSMTHGFLAVPTQ